MEPKQVIVMRKDLNMRKGKMIAQGAHASLAVLLDYMIGERETRFKAEHGWGYDGFEKPSNYLVEFDMNDPIAEWINNSFKKIVVGAEDLGTVVIAYKAAKVANIPCAIIEDKGLTEFGGEATITCCAIGPGDPEEIDKITGNLKLL